MSSFLNRAGDRARRTRWRGALSGGGAVGLALVAYALVGSFSLTVQAGQSRAVTAGVYTGAQAARGQALYKEKCLLCHDETLQGGLGPPLAGDAFNALWGNQPLSDLVTKIQKTMPQNEPGQLTRAQSVDLVAHMLQVGKFPAGSTELGQDDAVLAQIRFPAPAAVAARGVGQGPAFPPVGNLAQVMRGILFPSSNIIFNVQGQDPNAPRPVYEQGKLAFSWADWGAGIYSPWDVVDYAAISLAEAAPLLLTPGRRCENGKPVPVENADWVKFTQDMVEAGKLAYKASQTRTQMAVDEVSGIIADSCLACHEVYRDKPGGTKDDPSNKAARCVK
jgi:mono/diheme cytochrome c family protein